ncbi:MAG TPA: phage terminase large subunit [Holophagaceae bacterium]|nr:phage terminase large subunit [Holophagaceae bacterium]
MTKDVKLEDGTRERTYFLLDVFRKRLNYPDLKRAVVEQRRLYRTSKILIEERASGIQLIQDLARSGIRNVVPCQYPGDKVMRMHAQTAVIEQGRVCLPKAAAWLEDYRRELSAFPRGKFDDQVDATSQALAWMQEHPIVHWSGMAVGIGGSCPRWGYY